MEDELIVNPLRWDEQGLPHSVFFDDKYFCKENGYEETLYVSCQGNKLQERFSALDPTQPGTFTIIETGFGTGLNFCCAWSVWDQCAPKSWKLHFISLELYPLLTDELSRALSLWEPLQKYRAQLIKAYQPKTNTIDHLHLDDGRVIVTIVFDDILKALAIMHEQRLAPEGADAWFLDGFAPSKNPLMWADAVYAGMAKLSKPGTTLATFTVAGFVRRGLEAQGFEVFKALGYGTKKHILTGVFK